MSAHEGDLLRLSAASDLAARELVRSAALDAPSVAVREASLAHVLSSHRRRRAQQRRAWVAAGAALSLAAALALWVRSARSPEMHLARELLVPSGVSSLAQRNVAPPAPSPSAAELPPALQPCTPAVRATGNEPLIDDFEDANSLISPLEHRAGVWAPFSDGTGVQRPFGGGSVTPERIAGGRGSSLFALHLSGTKFSKWGAGLNGDLTARRCYDASVYAGLTFWSRGRGSFNVYVKMTQLVPEEFGGSCAHDCYDGHHAKVLGSAKWQEQRITWAELKQTGFGMQIPFDPHSLLSLELSVAPDQTPFDFWVDDVRFLVR